jgi:hypothetical protein
MKAPSSRLLTLVRAMQRMQWNMQQSAQRAAMPRMLGPHHGPAPIGQRLESLSPMPW